MPWQIDGLLPLAGGMGQGGGYGDHWARPSFAPDEPADEQTECDALGVSKISRLCFAAREPIEDVHPECPNCGNIVSHKRVDCPGRDGA